MNISAMVEMSEPTGAETIVVMRFGDEKVLGRVAPDIRLANGVAAQFSEDTRKLCLFDPQTEILIAATGEPENFGISP
jgi:multiple sugar transport system ATP-binding protein